MAYSPEIRWLSNQLVSATKLGQMDGNEIWTKACMDRLRVFHAHGGPYERSGDLLVVYDFKVSVTINSVEKVFTGGSDGLDGTLQSGRLVEWDLSSLVGDASNLYSIRVKVEARWSAPTGWHTIHDLTETFPLPNETSKVRYDYATALIDVTDAAWYREPSPVPANLRRGMSWNLNLWVHESPWASDWSVEEVA